MMSRIRNAPYWLWLISGYSACVIVLLWLTGCANPSALEAVVRSVVADGQVSPSEVQQIQAQLPQSFDWMQVLQVGGTIAGSLLGVKLIPDRHLSSPFDPKQPPVQPS